MTARFAEVPRRLGEAWDRARAAGRDGRAARALFGSPCVGTALLDPDGRIERANATLAAWTPDPAGLPATALIEEPERALLARALAGHGEVPASARLCTGQREVALCLTRFDGGAFLQLLDLSRERALEQAVSQNQKLQAVGRLAAGIAHDFNNLLTAITASVEEALARNPDPATAEDLRQIRASAKRGADLVRQILAFGQQQTLQPRRLSANDAVSSLAGMLRRVIGSGITLALDLEEPGRAILIDPTQLDRVLVNLVVNARDAMGGSGHITLATGHATVLRPIEGPGGTVPPGRYVTIDVRDTGHGIPDADLPRIFEPFFSTKSHTGGTGLGLATVHGIVRQSQGHVAVDSTPGQGTCFRLYLPRLESTPELHPPTPPPPNPSASRPRAILLVDDEAPIRKLAERALVRRGYTVLAAGSAEEALGLTRDTPHLGCVVSDVMMPGLDGPSLVRLLRSRDPSLPAILMSGYARESLREELASDAIHFLAKPFGIADLIAAVERTLSAEAVAKAG